MATVFTQGFSCIEEFLAPPQRSFIQPQRKISSKMIRLEREKNSNSNPLRLCLIAIYQTTVEKQSINLNRRANLSFTVQSLAASDSTGDFHGGI